MSARTNIQDRFLDLMSSKNLQEQYFYTDYRQLLELCLRFAMGNDYIDRSIGHNLHLVLKKNPTFSKRYSLKKFSSYASAVIHGSTLDYEILPSREKALEALKALIIECLSIELVVEENDAQDSDETHSFEDQSEVNDTKDVFEKDIQINGPWLVIVDEVDKNAGAFYGTVIDGASLDGQKKFILDTWEGQYAENTSQRKNSNELLRESFHVLVPGMKVSMVFITPRDNDFAPSHLTIEPDFLLTPSDIALATNGRNGGAAWAIQKRFLINKLKLSDTKAFFKGNVVNSMFDAMIHGHKDLTSLLRRGWVENSLGFERSKKVKIGDSFNFSSVITELKETYYSALIKTVDEVENGMRVSSPVNLFEEVEPTFIQPVYGLYGRLDYLRTYKDQNGFDYCDIIELKSSNYYGRPKDSDLDQLVCYDLMLRNLDYSSNKFPRMRPPGMRMLAYPKSIHSSDHVLHGFSNKSDKDDFLIPFAETQRVINGRNAIVAMIYDLVHTNDFESFKRKFFQYLNLNSDEGLGKFDLPGFTRLRSNLVRVNPLVLDYAFGLFSFGLKDKWLAAVGRKTDNSFGSSEIWIGTNEIFGRSNKLDNLQIVNIVRSDEQLISGVVFRRKSDRNERDNF